MNVIEELVEDRIDRAYVERRVADWKARIAELYETVTNWLPSDFRAWQDARVPMHEELMQRFGVPAQRLPILRIEGAGGRSGWMEPRGLWVIGANGRVDLILSPQHFILVNREDSFDPPKWRVADIDDRKNQRAFDQRFWGELLG